MAENPIGLTHEQAAAIDAAIRATTPGEAPSGIVYNPLFHTLDDPKFASAEPAEVPLRELRQILWELARGALHGEPPVELAALDRAVGDAARSGVVPVAIADYRFEAVDPKAIKRFLAGIRKDGTLALAAIDRAAILETRRVTLCRPLLDTIPDGDGVVFSFERDWHAANTGAGPTEIVFDPGDGHGPRHLPAGARLRVRYDSTGDKRVAAMLRFGDGHQAGTIATLRVKALSLPPFDWERGLFGVHSGVRATGNMKVYYAPGRSEIRKPLFMWQGFNVDDTMLGGESPFAPWSATAEDFLADPDVDALLEAARRAGYDIIVIEFHDSGKPIQANAAMVGSGIRFINGSAPTWASGTILTGSMGGLVARYLLLWMEHEERQGGPPHKIAKAILFDCPFKGAVTPIAVQYALDYFASVSGEARRRRDQLNSPSARQMLVQKYEAGWNSGPVHPRADDEFGRFANECRELGSWPEKTICYAATSGSGAGTGQRTDAGATLKPQDEMLYVERRTHEWKADAWLRAAPNFRAPAPEDFKVVRVQHYGGQRWEAAIRQTLPWDTCPGGWHDFVGTFAAAGDWTTRRLTASNSCFIPTLSALDVEPRAGGGDLYRKPPPASQTPFKEIYTPATNTQHCKLDRDVGNWMRRILGVPPL